MHMRLKKRPMSGYEFVIHFAISEWCLAAESEKTNQRKVFAKSSLLAEKFPVRSRRTGKFPDNLKFMYDQNNVRIILKESG